MDVSEASRMSAAKAEPRAKKTSLKMVSFPRDDSELSSVFGEVVNRADLTEEDRSALWLTTHEYQVLKQSARLESLACERENECTNLLENVFMEKCKHAQEKLNEWVSATPGRRGLEKTANKSLGDARQQAQFQAVMDTLRSQDEMLIASGAVDDEEVRKVSLKATRTARHFARMIAKADALEISGAESDAHDTASDDKQQSSARKNAKTKSNPSNPSSPTSLASTPSSKRTSKEKKEERKATAKAKKQDKATEKEEKQKAKAREKARGKENKRRNKEDPKRKTSFKEKLRETKAGIIARIPRIT